MKPPRWGEVACGAGGGGVGRAPSPPRSARPRRDRLGGRGRPGRARLASVPAAPQHPSAHSESLSCASFVIGARSARRAAAPPTHSPTLARRSRHRRSQQYSHGAAREPDPSPAMSRLPHFALCTPCQRRQRRQRMRRMGRTRCSAELFNGERPAGSDGAKRRGAPKRTAITRIYSP